MVQVTSKSVAVAFTMVVSAGMCTVLGGLVVCCVSSANHKVLSLSLGLAAGVMVYVSFVEILSTSAMDAFQEAGATKPAGARYATLGFFAGALLTWLLDKLADKLLDLPSAWHNWQQRRRAAATAHSTNSEASSANMQVMVVAANTTDGVRARAHHPCCGAVPACTAAGHHGLELQRKDVADARRPPSASGTWPAGGCGSAACTPGLPCAICRSGFQVEATPECCGDAVPEAAPSDVMSLLTSESGKLSRLGLLAAMAIGIHNAPEGLATFIASVESPKLGAVIVVSIALHNILEGICIAMPIYCASGSRLRALLMCFIAGMAEPVGGLIGLAVLSQAGATPLTLAVMFSIVAGMMVYISLAELLPTALKYDRSRRLAVAGLYSGMAVMASSLLLFEVA